MSHTNRNQPTIAERNLRQAADAIDNTGWAVARLIASSVEVGKGNGRPPKTSATGGGSEKVSVAKATSILRKSDHTIARYLDAWAKAANDGHCTPAADLTPEDGQTANLPAAHLWEHYYNPRTNTPKNPTETRPEPAVAAQQMTVEEKRAFIAREIKADPVAAAAARKAVEEREVEAEEKWGPKLARAKEQSEARHKEMSGVSYVAASGALHSAAREIAKAKKEIEGVRFTDEQRDLLTDDVAALAVQIDALKVALNVADWDAALAALTNGGEK